MVTMLICFRSAKNADIYVGDNDSQVLVLTLSAAGGDTTK